MKKKSSLTDSMERLLLFLTPRAGLAKMFLLINISFIQIFFFGQNWKNEVENDN